MRDSDEKLRLLDWASKNVVSIERVYLDHYRVKWISVYDQIEVFSVCAESLLAALERAELVSSEDVDSCGQLPDWAKFMLDK